MFETFANCQKLKQLMVFCLGLFPVVCVCASLTYAMGSSSLETQLGPQSEELVFSRPSNLMFARCAGFIVKNPRGLCLSRSQRRFVLPCSYPSGSTSLDEDMSFQCASSACFPWFSHQRTVAVFGQVAQRVALRGPTHCSELASGRHVVYIF